MHKDLIPEIQYARHGGIAVAYQAVGDGPQELVFVPFLSSLISIWELPAMRAFFDRLSAETRLTVLNPRGMGQSDRPRNVTLEDWAEDVLAVLDAQGIERATLFGASDSANACVLTAATYPERVERLVLHSPFARRVRSEDYPAGTPEDELLAFLRAVRGRWGIATSCSSWPGRSTPSGPTRGSISTGSSGITASPRALLRRRSTGACRSARTSPTCSARSGCRHW